MGTPRLSIVIPTLGRPDSLARVLGRLTQQDVEPEAFDVLVVCDAAEPDPVRVRQIAAEHDLALSVEQAERPGASANRNLGWRQSRANLVCFLDDDVLPDPRLVAEHLAWHASHPAPEVAVLGDVRWADELRVTPLMEFLDGGLLFDFAAIEGTDAGWGRFYSANVSLKRDLLSRSGGFDERNFPFLYEDTDLAARLDSLGMRLLYNRAASAEHLYPTTLDRQCERMAAVAVAERRFAAVHPEHGAHYHDLFQRWERERLATQPDARGRGARLAELVPGLVPGWLPWIGSRVRASAEGEWRRRLAEAFLDAWRADAAAHPAVPASKPSGSPPAGPK